MSKSKLLKPLIKVTAFSKLLALLLIIIFVLFGFYLGLEYGKQVGMIGAVITPLPTPTLQNQFSCTTDNDCTLMDSKAQGVGLCCSNLTRCMDPRNDSVIAVNTKWFTQKKQTDCSQTTACPMIAMMCTYPVVMAQQHYHASCVNTMCQKVYH